MKKFIFLTLLFLESLFANASHVIGGELYVEWISQNEYIIHAKVYRDNNNAGNPLPAILTAGIYQYDTHNQLKIVDLNLDSVYIVDLGDPCYTPDPNVVEIEVGLYSSIVTNIGDHPAGYYLQAQIFARNALAINLANASQEGMAFFCQIPDPALGQNSSPVLAIYPGDAYLCVSTNKTFNFNATDPDGDSLYYELTEPLRGPNINNTPTAGTGAYPFYSSVPWAAGYSLANIVGGTPMTIDPNNGDITAAPTALGFFTFAIKVEEYRNSIKIGEIRRDIQYASLLCTVGVPPTSLNIVPTNSQTINIPYGKEYCKDLIFRDINITDTIYIELVSSIFTDSAYIPTLTPDINGDIHYFYNGSGDPIVWNNSVAIPPNQHNNIGEFNVGTIAKRFCWTPNCTQINSTFPFQVNSFSLGCDGRSQDSVAFNIKVVAPFDDLGIIPNVLTPNGDGMNDVFKISGISNPCTDMVKVKIYNRWGTLVYESLENPSFEWDGSKNEGGKVSDGTYFIIISGIFGDEDIPLSKRTINVLGS